MPARFKVEHVATVPRGYKVRTVVRDAHRVRIAFPRGRRVTGSGRVVQILHPLRENPPCRLPNPAELVVMMANPGAGRTGAGETVKLSKTAVHFEHPAKGPDRCGICKHFRKASQTCSIVAGHIEAADWCDRFEPRTQKNPSEGHQATELYEQFHGTPGRHIDEYHEPSPRSATMTELGDLIELRVKTDVGWKLRSLNFAGNGIKIASNASGTQIYFVGGKQRIGSLSLFGADRSKELLDLGECCYIAYRARKAQVSNFPSNYEHFLGEETGRCPRLMYDHRRGQEPRLYLTGGEYRVESAGIVN